MERGEEAWLGKEAPENAGFDVIDDDPFSDDTIDTSKHPDFAPGREGGGRSTPGLCGRVRDLRGRGQDIDPAGRSQRPRRGVRISKTSLIRGEGAFVKPSSTRGITRPYSACTDLASSKTLDIDFTGFSAVRVEGKWSCDPLIEHAWIGCSGDFGVVVAGESAPTFIARSRGNAAGCVSCRTARRTSSTAS